MSVAVAALLVIGVGAAWLGATALLRLRPLARVHAVAFVNMVGGGAVTLATWIADGPSGRSAKMLLIWIVLLVSGALSAHVTGRAVHLRGGDRL